MIEKESIWLDKLSEILEETKIKLSNQKPSDWYEANMVMPLGSAFPGPYRYSKTPYLKEIVDCLSIDHPAHTIAVMKGAQIGVSAGVLTPAVGYIISEAPGNTLFLTGHADLSKNAVDKIDVMIDNTGIRDLIVPHTKKRKTQKTGDTDKEKQFAGGSLILGSATNHNLLRQYDIQYAIIDDFDAAKKSGRETGSTTDLIEQRTAAFATKRKIFYVSTPQLKAQSNIEPAYLLGDQRKYHIPCPCCGEHIELCWETTLKGTEKEKAGITWKVDEDGKLIDDSVGYICQECGDFFTDHDKSVLLQNGKWIPTAEPSEQGYFSYHINALYAPPGMKGWEDYVRQWLKAHPKNGAINQEKVKVFKNVALGLTYEQEARENKASDIQKNQRNYKPGTVPEGLSIKDGNGKIVLLTLAADLNGTEDDARLDFEVVAWSETGSSYSVTHGSIGTFIPREGKNKVDRDKWTYRHNTQKSVWDQLRNVLLTKYELDNKSRKMTILIAGIDAGYLDKHVFPFVDNPNAPGVFVYALKGDVTARFTKTTTDQRYFKPSKAHGKMYILESNLIKDDLSDLLQLKWNPKTDTSQPAGFLNFPQSDGGLYQYNNFFSHFEAEKREAKYNALGDIEGFMWTKKNSVVQNHMYDCHCYNMALKGILTQLIGKEMKIQNPEWSDIVQNM